MQILSTCPVCGNQTIPEQYRHKDTLGTVWTVVGCSACGLGFINPQPNWAELAPYYEQDYAAYENSHAAEAEDEFVVREAKKSGEFRFTPIKSGIRLLDVGCGGGYFLRIASKLGAIVQGVEPSSYAASVARSAGLSVFNGSMENFVAEFPQSQFDVITSNHVLEHTPDPVKTLSAMCSVLAPNGVMVIAVPNADYWACRSLRGLWHSTDLPRHLIQFNAKSLTFCGSKAGLKLRNLKTYSLPKAVAATVRIWLRRRMFIPTRILQHVGVIDSVVAPNLGSFLDERGVGEALIAEFTH